MFRNLVIGLLLISMCKSTPAAQVRAAHSVRVSGAVQKDASIDATTLRRDFAGQVQTVSLTTHGTTERYDAVPLIAVIEKVGLRTSERRNAEVGLVVAVRARDGYVVAFGLGELLPNTGARDVFLAFGRQGEALPPEMGPMRLVVPSDKRGARSTFAVSSIELVDLGAGARSQH